MQLDIEALFTAERTEVAEKISGLPAEDASGMVPV